MILSVIWCPSKQFRNLRPMRFHNPPHDSSSQFLAGLIPMAFERFQRAMACHDQLMTPRLINRIKYVVELTTGIRTGCRATNVIKEYSRALFHLNQFFGSDDRALREIELSGPKLLEQALQFDAIDDPAIFNREPYNSPGEQCLADATPPKQASRTKRFAEYLLDHFTLARMAGWIRLECVQVNPSKLRWNYIEPITN